MRRARPCGLAALAVIVALAQPWPASGGVLSGLGAIPNPFSPNADGLLDSTAVHYTLSDTAAIVVTVTDWAEAHIDTVWAGWSADGEHHHWWSGRLGGVPVADGEYRFVVTAIPKAGGLENAGTPFTVDTVSPTLSELSATPSRFSPDGDGVGDSLFVSVRLELSGDRDHVLLRVMDTGMEPLRELAGASGADSLAASWGGTDDGGTSLSDGLYVLRADAWDDAGNGCWVSVLADLDTAPPTLSVDLSDPDAGELRVETATAGVSGTAYDRGGVVAVELSLDLESWTEVEFSGPDTAHWQHSLSCGSCVPGETDEHVTVYVRARDGTPTATGQGHVNTEDTIEPMASFDLVYDVAAPVHDTTYVKGGDATFLPGETISLSTQWDESGYEIVADLSLIDSEFDTSDVEWSGSGSGLYTVEYEVSTLNSLPPVYDGLIRIRAIDSFGRAASDSSLAVTVLPGLAESARTSVSANSFDPAAGESVTISPGAGSTEMTVRIYNLAGTLVAEMDSEGDSAVVWNGRNEAAELVASGVYVILIETNLGDATRLVAVVK